MLAFVAGWPLSWRSPPAWIARDVLLPALWGQAWTGDDFVWRGNAMSVDETMLGEAASGPPQQMCESLPGRLRRRALEPTEPQFR